MDLVLFVCLFQRQHCSQRLAFSSLSRDSIYLERVIVKVYLLHQDAIHTTHEQGK